MKKCQFFLILKLKYTYLKTGPINSKNMQCTILSIRGIILKQNGVGYPRGAPRGAEAKGLNQQFLLAPTDWDPWIPSPWGAPQCTQSDFVNK